MVLLRKIIENRERQVVWEWGRQVLNRWTGQASLRKWHLSRDMNKMRE